MNVSQIEIAIHVPVCVHIKINEREVLPLVITIQGQYSNRNKPR